MSTIMLYYVCRIVQCQNNGQDDAYYNAVLYSMFVGLPSVRITSRTMPTIMLYYVCRIVQCQNNGQDDAYYTCSTMFVGLPSVRITGRTMPTAPLPGTTSTMGWMSGP